MEFQMSWLAGIALFALAALILAFVTDAQMTKCEALTVSSVIGLCVPEPIPEPSGIEKNRATR
jgi:hypothetical protein